MEIVRVLFLDIFVFIIWVFHPYISTTKKIKIVKNNNIIFKQFKWFQVISRDFKWFIKYSYNLQTSYGSYNSPTHSYNLHNSYNLDNSCNLHNTYNLHSWYNYITHINYVTHIIYITHITSTNHTIKLIFKAYKKTTENIFINSFLYIKMANNYYRKHRERIGKEAREKYQT